MNECIFCRIIKKEIPSTTLFEDDQVIVIKDIHPQAKVHLLAIPKLHIKEFYELQGAEPLVSLHKALRQMIDEHGLMEKGYMVRAYGGGAQEVDHLHFHLLSPISHPDA